MNRKENHQKVTHEQERKSLYIFLKKPREIEEVFFLDVLQYQLSKKIFIFNHNSIASPPRSSNRDEYILKISQTMHQQLEELRWGQIMSHEFLSINSQLQNFVFLILFSQCVYIIHACPSNFLEVYLLATPLFYY